MSVFRKNVRFVLTITTFFRIELIQTDRTLFLKTGHFSYVEKCLSKFTPLPHWGSTTTLGNCALLARCLAIFQQFSLKIWFFQCRLFSNEKPLPVSSDLLRLFQKCTCPLCVKPFIFPAIIMLFAPLLTFNHHQYNEMMSLTNRGPPCLPFLRIQGKFPPRALHRPSR